MKLNSEKVELPPRPRPALSLVSTSPRVSELEDAASTREGDADEFSLVQLHHRLELECLPPVDQGKHAYLFLLACFILEALIWGYPFCFGIFSGYYARTPPFAGSSAIANIGTCCSGLMYLCGLPALVLNRMFPRWARYSPLVGLFISCAALFVSAYARNVTELIITQGVFYGIGGAIAYMPCIMYIDEWFVKRKGLAYGIMWSGTGLAGVVLPLILEKLLEVYGYKTTMIIWAVVLFAITAPLAWYIKPRMPPLPVRRLKAFNFRFCLSRRFVMYQLSNTVEAIGFYIPGIYIPIYSASVFGANHFATALCILLFNISSVVGCIVIGWLIDRFHVTTCVLVTTVGATLGTFLLWGCAINMPMVYIFCVSYGLSAGSFSTTWTGVMREVAGKDMSDSVTPSELDGGSEIALGAGSGSGAGGAGPAESPLSEYTGSYSEHIDPIMVFVMLAAGRGFGNVVSGPLSQVMYHSMPWKGEALLAYGSGYGSLVVFTGVTAIGSGLCFIGRRVGWC
ncbi:major facilitator superfamily domain-containing protein [Diaporthe sp. PMI_573]|nr:major facilitator superfamily domain-containing protein [Diaporthaceae sp. PMI_573]